MKGGLLFTYLVMIYSKAHREIYEKDKFIEIYNQKLRRKKFQKPTKLDKIWISNKKVWII